MLKVTLPNAHNGDQCLSNNAALSLYQFARLRKLTFLRNLDLTLEDFHTEKAEMRL
jgi:hypothetical protein